MRSLVMCVALFASVAVAQAPAGNPQDKFPPAPKVPSDRVLIVPAATVALAQTRVPGIGTTLYDGGTFAASGLRRTNADEGPVMHKLTTEVYVIQKGSGTYTSGGSLEGPIEEHPGTPDAYFGKSIKGGSVHEVKEGDVLVIPAGVPHQFTKVNGSVAYINVKFQAKK